MLVLVSVLVKRWRGGRYVVGHWSYWMAGGDGSCFALNLVRIKTYLYYSLRRLDLVRKRAESNGNDSCVY